MTCDKCGHEMLIGEFPFCPHDKQANSVIGDECDVTIRHGLCNSDGSPRRYRSKTEIRREEQKRGMTNYVEHKPDSRGSDKSKHTQRWF